MGWQDIYKNPYWEYDNNPPDPGGTQSESALWATGTDGIRTTVRGEEVYMNCRHKILHANRALEPSEISKTFWDTTPMSNLWGQHGNPRVAYSLRDLTGENPTTIKVRRDSDDAEEDFKVSELYDGTLESWVGSGNNGFIKTWYDQVGTELHDPQNITGFYIEGCGDGMDGEWDKIADFNGKVQFQHATLTNGRIRYQNDRWEMGDEITSGAGNLYYHTQTNPGTTYPFEIENNWVVGPYGTGTPEFESFDDGWYHESGKGGMLTMHAKIFQPKIVDATLGYLGEIDFDTSNDRLNAHFELDVNPAIKGFASFIVCRHSSSSAADAQVLLRSKNNGVQHQISFSNSGQYIFQARDGVDPTKTFKTQETFGDNQYKIFTTMINDSSQAYMFVDGVEKPNQYNKTPLDFSSVDDASASDNIISPVGNPFMGAIKEMIFFEENQFTNRADFERDINEYYQTI